MGFARGRDLEDLARLLLTKIISKSWICNIRRRAITGKTTFPTMHTAKYANVDRQTAIERRMTLRIRPATAVLLGRELELRDVGTVSGLEFEEPIKREVALIWRNWEGSMRSWTQQAATMASPVTSANAPQT